MCPMRSPRLEIEYCTQCRWLMRASWTASELLTTFVEEVLPYLRTHADFPEHYAEPTLRQRLALPSAELSIPLAASDLKEGTNS